MRDVTSGPSSLLGYSAAAAAVLVATGAAFAYDVATQAVTIRLIVCAAHAMEQPTLQILGAPTQYVNDSTAARALDGTWTLSLRLPPGYYYLTAVVPRNERDCGCSHLERFAVLPGHDRHLAGVLRAGGYIGGEGFDRALVGSVPFENMAVTEQRLDYPMAEIPVEVDGTMYDAESLGPHPYLLRFYLPGSDRYTSFEIDFRHTASGSHLQRNLGLDEVRSDEGSSASPTFDVFNSTGAAAQAMVVAFANLVKARHLTWPASDLNGYFVNESTQNPRAAGDKILYFIEFIPKAEFDEKTHRENLASGACVRNGRPHASFVVREDMVVTERNLCVPNP